MSTYAQGGYSQVIFHKDTNTIEKQQLLYSSNEWISYTTFTDIVMHQSLQTMSGLPHLTHYSISHSTTSNLPCLSMHMPFLGQTLYDYMKKIPMHDRLHEITHLMTQVIDICCDLQHQGILHTDIKPNNILVDSNQKVHVIDFNIVSIQKNPTEWVQGIGTWNYAPPEIVLHFQPTVTSIPWSIGMMIASLCYRFPFPSRTARPTSKQSASRRFWRKLQEHLHTTNYDHWPIPSDFETRFPPIWCDLLRDALRWDPSTRISLEDMRTRINAYHVPTITKTIEWPCDPSQWPLAVRARIIGWFFQFCKAWDLFHLFSNMVCILDRSGVFFQTQHVSSCEMTSVIIIMMLYLQGEHVHDRFEWLDWIQSNLSMTEMDFPRIQRRLWELGEFLSFQIWQKPWMHEQESRDEWLKLKRWFQYRTKPYHRSIIGSDIKKTKKQI